MEMQRGAQTLHRAMAVLRCVAEGGHEGRRATEIAKDTGLHVATANRLLIALALEGLLEQVNESKRYRVGPEILALNLRANRSFAIERTLRPAIRAIADKTGDTVFLMIRSGFSAICICREEGGSPVKTMTLDIGDRRPLGISSGGLALLAFSPKYEYEQLIINNADDYAEYGQTVESIRTLVERTRRNGYASNDERILPRVASIAAPVYSYSGRAIAAITVVAVSERLKPSRRDEILGILGKEIGRLAPIID
jgi:DNA-binding IclR family transcriptional regulator